MFLSHSRWGSSLKMIRIPLHQRLWQSALELLLDWPIYWNGSLLWLRWREYWIRLTYHHILFWLLLVITLLIIMTAFDWGARVQVCVELLVMQSLLLLMLLLASNVTRKHCRGATLILALPRSVGRIIVDALNRLVKVIQQVYLPLCLHASGFCITDARLLLPFLDLLISVLQWELAPCSNLAVIYLIKIIIAAHNCATRESLLLHQALLSPWGVLITT